MGRANCRHSLALCKAEARRGGGLLKTGEGRRMGQFYVTVYVSNPRLAQIATEAMLDGTPITMDGDFDGKATTVTGFVQSVEAASNAMNERWRITFLENATHSDWVVSFPSRFRDAARKPVASPKARQR